VYKIHGIKEVTESKTKQIEEEKKWVKHKERMAVKTFLELLCVGIILFVVRKFTSEIL